MYMYIDVHTRMYAHANAHTCINILCNIHMNRVERIVTLTVVDGRPWVFCVGVEESV